MYLIWDMPGFKTKPVPKEEYKDMFFELTGREGEEFLNLRINRWGYKNKFAGPLTIQGGDKRQKKILHVICKVVGLIDDRAPMRNWGLMSKKLGKKKG